MGGAQTNPAMQRQLDEINALAYAFLQVDAAGDVYFANRPSICLRSTCGSYLVYRI